MKRCSWPRVKVRQQSEQRVRAGKLVAVAAARNGGLARRISARTPGNTRLRRGASAQRVGTRLDDAPVASDLRRTVKVLLQVHLHKLKDQVQPSLQVDDVAQPARRRTAWRVSRCGRAPEPLPLQGHAVHCLRHGTRALRRAARPLGTRPHVLTPLTHACTAGWRATDAPAWRAAAARLPPSRTLLRAAARRTRRCWGAAAPSATISPE